MFPSGIQISDCMCFRTHLNIRIPILQYYRQRATPEFQAK